CARPGSTYEGDYW
nr:immunoglobulin heavy chain junction region [Mus musculus]